MALKKNLVLFGTGLFLLAGMIMVFLAYVYGNEITEPGWLLLGTGVGGFIAYATLVAQSLTSPEPPPPSMTEEQHNRDMKYMALAAGANPDAVERISG